MKLIAIKDLNSAPVERALLAEKIVAAQRWTRAGPLTWTQREDPESILQSSDSRPAGVERTRETARRPEHPCSTPERFDRENRRRGKAAETRREPRGLRHQRHRVRFPVARRPSRACRMAAFGRRAAVLDDRIAAEYAEVLARPVFQLPAVE